MAKDDIPGYVFLLDRHDVQLSARHFVPDPVHDGDAYSADAVLAAYAETDVKRTRSDPGFEGVQDDSLIVIDQLPGQFTNARAAYLRDGRKEAQVYEA